MPESPRPGMGQDEKDRLGQALHDAHQDELRRDAETRKDDWLPDDKLDGLTRAELVEEANRRGLHPGRIAAKDDLLALLRGPAQPAEEKPKRASRTAKNDEQGEEQ